MTKKVLFIALILAIAVIALHSSRSEPVANTELAQVSSLQQAVGSTTEVDLSSSRAPCHVCAKDPTRCLQTCALEHCPGGCN